MIKRYENYIMLKITKYLWTKKHGLLINASFTGYFASKERKGWDQVYEMSPVRGVVSFYLMQAIKIIAFWSGAVIRYFRWCNRTGFRLFHVPRR